MQGHSPGEAQRLAPPARPLHQTVVARVQDGAVVIQDAVNLAPSSLTTAFALDKDGAAATIGAGGHQRHGAGIQQQLVQRGMGRMTQGGDAGAIPSQRRFVVSMGF